METIDGKWTMCGCEWDDPMCLHTIDEAVAYIEKVGFLPFFQCDIPGYSLEEHTYGKNWWGVDQTLDPWIWREVIAKDGNIAYGKFFAGKGGFITKEWIPYFANFRRDGYDFDALWDDGKASVRQKKIMDLFNDYTELFSFEAKQKAGFGKGGEKNFEGTVSSLQMMLYLSVKEFRQKKNKAGEGYGWNIAIYSTPEQMWGSELLTKAYGESAAVSKERLVNHVREMYPDVTDKQLKSVI